MQSFSRGWQFLKQAWGYELRGWRVEVDPVNLL